MLLVPCNLRDKKSPSLFDSSKFPQWRIRPDECGLIQFRRVSGCRLESKIEFIRSIIGGCTKQSKVQKLLFLEPINVAPTA